MWLGKETSTREDGGHNRGSDDRTVAIRKLHHVRLLSGAETDGELFRERADFQDPKLFLI